VTSSFPCPSDRSMGVRDAVRVAAQCADSRAGAAFDAAFFARVSGIGLARWPVRVGLQESAHKRAEAASPAEQGGVA
jgi:hypothetical protein